MLLVLFLLGCGGDTEQKIEASDEGIPETNFGEAIVLNNRLIVENKSNVFSTDLQGNKSTYLHEYSGNFVVSTDVIFSGVNAFKSDGSLVDFDGREPIKITNHHQVGFVKSDSLNGFITEDGLSTITEIDLSLATAQSDGIYGFIPYNNINFVPVIKDNTGTTLIFDNDALIGEVDVTIANALIDKQTGRIFFAAEVGIAPLFSLELSSQQITQYDVPMSSELFSFNDLVYFHGGGSFYYFDTDSNSFVKDPDIPEFSPGINSAFQHQESVLFATTKGVWMLNEQKELSFILDKINSNE
jgi:hypothetical protein